MLSKPILIIVSLLLTLKCWLASLGRNGGCVCHPLKNMVTDFVLSPSVVSHIWKELPGNICKPSHAPCLRKLQQSSLGQRSAETRYWPCSSFLHLPDLLSVLQFLFCAWTAPSPVRACNVLGITYMSSRVSIFSLKCRIQSVTGIQGVAYV